MAVSLALMDVASYRAMSEDEEPIPNPTSKAVIGQLFLGETAVNECKIRPTCTNLSYPPSCYPFVCLFLSFTVFFLSVCLLYIPWSLSLSLCVYS